MNRLNPIIVRIFKVKPEEINDEMSHATVSQWDSMNYLMFISEIEKEFGFSFTMDEVLHAEKLADIKEYMHKRGISI